MKKENRQRVLYRYTFIIGCILLLTILIVYRLVDNTVISAQKWRDKAAEELERRDTIPPERGDILACDGSILATNMRIYTTLIDFRCPKFDAKHYALAIDSIADSLALYFPNRTRQQWYDHLKKPIEMPESIRPRAYTIVRDVSHAENKLVRSFPFFCRKKRYNGYKEEDRLARVRPYGDMARRSIGAVGKTDKINRPFGKYGLEKALDSLLYGKPGYSKKVALTKAIVNWEDVPPVDGYDVTTTIDIKMQDIVENELNKVLEYTDAEWGVAILMEVATGDIKAISNLQTSNEPGKGYIEAMNRAVLPFEPGSVVKTLSMLIALEDGIVSNLNEVIPTGPSYAYAGGRPIRDSHVTGSMPVREVLEQSSNIAMTRIITRKYGSNPGAFYSRLKSIGFLEPMNTGIAGEQLPKVDSLPNNNGGRISLARQSYGYATALPPIYTMSIYNAIANGGRYVRPRLVKGLRNEFMDTVFEPTYIRERICSESNARILRELLTRVVWGDRGTARRVLRSDKVRIAGKTGTANMIGPNGYIAGRNRLAFCGFFPAEEPKYTCMVLINDPREHWRGAATTSGRVVLNVAEALYARGMLGNSSDFRSPDEPHDDSHPTFYASLIDGENQTMHSQLAIKGKRGVLKSPQTLVAEGKVPDVTGLGIRQAIARLEKSGYNVEFDGAGYVAAQHPASGQTLARGDRVKLTLRE